MYIIGFVICQQVTGTGARRPVSLVPLRVFALRMKELLSANPEGMKLSAVVPEYNKMFQTQFRADVYGKPKLLPVVESIPDVVKVREGEPTTLHVHVQICMSKEVLYLHVTCSTCTYPGANVIHKIFKS